jgi:hypothetical protein
MTQIKRIFTDFFKWKSIKPIKTNLLQDNINIRVYLFNPCHPCSFPEINRTKYELQNSMKLQREHSYLQKCICWDNQ